MLRIRFECRDDGGTMDYNIPNYQSQTTKTCRHCGMQIPYHAKNCHYCYKSQRDVKQTIFKVIGIYLLICFVGMILVRQNDEGEKEKDVLQDSVSQEETEQVSEEVSTFEYADITMKYLKSEIVYNAIDEKCLFVYFEMTNDSDENQAFSYLVTCKAFQNGIELDTNYIYDSDEERNGSKEIQPGATITVAEVFELGDSTDNVTLEVRPFNIWSDRLLFEKEIPITE